ncbi:hypothetical protein QGN23_01500 [Chryseobacterium gotjawalense]|uniref:Lipoprotein n=1 Tax=Chryseobacterium gotjawalense TaxID=3042315 RepID=A0ABY8RFJ3_9FLAO|nr:hypothetical protein [Chryseobacterium sp. wdc7]WHF51963.1 hypothetical protein QGN23_01500 [Chryseobacterium sp. wdc7]
MVKIIFSILSLGLLNACVGSNFVLSDGFTKVPISSYRFSNKYKFSSDTLKDIDINYFYELEYSYDSDPNFYKKGEKIAATWGKTLQFYPNGQVREFAKKFSNKNRNITGNRGILYQDKYLFIDMYGAISDGAMRIITYKIKIENDKIFLLEKTFLGGDNLCRVFAKKNKIPEDWKQYEANW